MLLLFSLFSFSSVHSSPSDLHKGETMKFIALIAIIGLIIYDAVMVYLCDRMERKDDE